MERFVTIPALPPNLQFPPDLSDKIRYDPADGRLSHDGFMSEAEFDRLNALSDDWGYRRRLEDLFRLCTGEPAPKPGLARLFSSWTGSRD